MTIADAEHPADDRGRGEGAGEVEAHLEPAGGGAVRLAEEVSHGRMEVRAQLLVRDDARGLGLVFDGAEVGVGLLDRPIGRVVSGASSVLSSA